MARCSAKTHLASAPRGRRAVSSQEVLKKVLSYRGSRPLDPNTGDPVRGPYRNPVVFLAPHPDDESIAMGGSIAKAVKDGNDVFIEMLTHGEASKAGFRLLFRGQWVFGETLAKARVAEVLDVARRLGVKGIKVNDFGDGDVTREEVLGRVRWWESQVPGEFVLRGTAGPGDPTLGKKTPHPDHAATWEALSESRVEDVAGFMVYTYQTGQGVPDEYVELGAEERKAKQDALDAYGVWDPKAGRFAVGESSVGKLLADAGRDSREYLKRPRRKP